jgi:hypothetical protein
MRGQEEWLAALRGITVGSAAACRAKVALS